MDAIDIPNLDIKPPNGDLPPASTNDLPPKRTRRRKTATPPQPEKPEATPLPVISQAELEAVNKALSMGFGVTFEIIAVKRGDHWKLGKPEADALGQTWGVALAPFLARGAKYLPFAMAALVTAGIITPRLQEDAKRVEQENTKDKTIPAQGE